MTGQMRAIWGAWPTPLWLLEPFHGAGPERAGGFSGRGQGRAKGRRREGAPGIPHAPPPLAQRVMTFTKRGGRERSRGAGSARPCDAGRERAAAAEPPSFLPLIPGCHGDPQQPDPHQLQLVAHLGAGERCGQAGGGPRRARGIQPRPLAQGEPGSVPLDPVLQLTEGTAQESRGAECTRWPGGVGEGIQEGGRGLRTPCERLEGGRCFGVGRVENAGLLSRRWLALSWAPGASSPVLGTSIMPLSLPERPSLLEG